MYRVVNVERLPAKLEENIVYVSEEYDVAALNCPCGCGHRVNLLLGDGHRVEDVGGLATVWPSIGVWDAPCRSHFWISKGRVLWAGQWSDEQISSAMERQVERHVATTQMPRRWYHRLVSWLINFFRR